MTNLDIMRCCKYGVLCHCMLHANIAFAGSKLLLVVRHGQAISNWLGDTLGPDEWFGVEETCAYTDSNNTTWGIFDAGNKDSLLVPISHF